MTTILDKQLASFTLIEHGSIYFAELIPCDNFYVKQTVQLLELILILQFIQKIKILCSSDRVDQIRCADSHA